MANEMIEHFWSLIDKGYANKCWNWKGKSQPNKSGMLYGRFYFLGESRSHRIAYILHNNNIPIPDGLVVGHSCDNSLCCNPYHLIKGTQRENVEDTFDRGRENILCGSAHGMAKLNEDQVKEIKVMLTKNYGQRYIAKQFGVSQNQISRINSGKDWKDV